MGIVFLAVASPGSTAAAVVLVGIGLLTLVNIAVGAAYAREDHRLSLPQRRTWAWVILLFNLAVLPYFWWRHVFEAS